MISRNNDFLFKDIQKAQILSSTQKRDIRKILGKKMYKQPSKLPEPFKLPDTSIIIRKQPNPGTDNTCMFLSIRDILIQTNIVHDISVEELRHIGGLHRKPDGRMWDSANPSHHTALQRICDFFNINIDIHTTNRDNYMTGYIIDGEPVPIAESFISQKLNPLKVHISHLGLHFEAIISIIKDSKNIYNITTTSGPNINYKPLIEKLEPGEEQSFIKLDGSEYMDGVKITRFSENYYLSLIASKLNPIQQDYHLLINNLTDMRSKLSTTRKKYLSDIKNQEKLIKYLSTHSIDVHMESIIIDLHRMLNNLRTSEQQINSDIETLLTKINLFK